MASVFGMFNDCLSNLSFCNLTGAFVTLGVEDVWVNNRRFRLLGKIGEGGYATVYLAKELPTIERPVVEQQPYAVKKMLAASGEKLAAATQELEIHKKLVHPNLLRLLEGSVVPNNARDGDLSHTVYMVFPAYQDGTLATVLEQLHASGHKLTSQQVLSIFLQICRGVKHIHDQGYAHRDLKPHNVLVRKPKQVLISDTSCVTSDAGHDRDLESGDGSGCGGGGEYEAVVMDFGSARPARVTISSRLQALALQEDAEAHCTATYRAPELFDVPSSCTLDERMDVWSLGCTLYHLMYCMSPFDKAVMQSGGSIALAVINCAVWWPKPSPDCYPPELHQLVMDCLVMPPDQRPFTADVINRISELQAKHLPSPASAMGSSAKHLPRSTTVS